MLTTDLPHCVAADLNAGHQGQDRRGKLAVVLLVQSRFWLAGRVGGGREFERAPLLSLVVALFLH